MTASTDPRPLPTGQEATTGALPRPARALLDDTGAFPPVSSPPVPASNPRSRVLVRAWFARRRAVDGAPPVSGPAHAAGTGWLPRRAARVDPAVCTRDHLDDDPRFDAVEAAASLEASLLDDDGDQLVAMTGRLLLWERQQATLATLGRAALGAPDLVSALEDVCELAADVLDLDVVEIHEVVGPTLVVVAAHGSDPHAAPLEGPSQQHWSVARPGEVVVADLATEDRFPVDPGLADLGVATASSVAVVDVGSCCWGTITAAGLTPRTVDEDEITFLSALAGLVGDVVAHFDRLDALQRRADAFAALLDRPGDVVVVTDPEGGDPQVLGDYEHLFGRDPQALATRPHDWLGAVELDDVPVALALQEGSHPDESTYRVGHRDGTRRRVVEYRVPVRGPLGDVVAVARHLRPRS